MSQVAHQHRREARPEGVKPSTVWSVVVPRTGSAFIAVRSDPFASCEYVSFSAVRVVVSRIGPATHSRGESRYRILGRMEEVKADRFGCRAGPRIPSKHPATVNEEAGRLERKRPIGAQCLELDVSMHDATCLE